MLNAPIARRHFLRTLVYLMGCGQSLGKLCLAKDPVDPLAAKLAKCCGHKASAAVVGMEALHTGPGETGVDLLVDLICSGRRTELANADERTLRSLLLHQQRQDFEQGRIMNVRGWILSATEVRLCALAALV